MKELKEFNDYIIYKEVGINRELFKEYFNFRSSSFMLRDLSHTNDTKKNDESISLIRSGLKDLKKEIEKMPDRQIEIEKPDKMVDAVEEILDFNKNYQNQEGKALKILSPQQMLSRLPISLAQLKAGNNSR